LVHGVVIIEAAMRSGTLITARYANDLGREVFALPGHPLDPRAEGTNRLIKSGATFVTALEDVVEVLRPIIGLDEPRADYGLPVDTASNQTSYQTPSGNIAPGDLMNAVLTALRPAPVAIDAIARATGLSVQDVQIPIADQLDTQGAPAAPRPMIEMRSLSRNPSNFLKTSLIKSAPAL
jgi:DNA processing protein